MDIETFFDMHYATLASDEVRHNVLLNILRRARDNPDGGIRFWGLERAGACAMQQPGFGIVLGDVTAQEASTLAQRLRDEAYLSVMGTGQTAAQFVAAARTHGHTFDKVMCQTIHLLDQEPLRPEVAGHAQLATESDVDVVDAWLTAFSDEAVPEDPPRPPGDAARRIADERVFLWWRDDRPVAMSCLARMHDAGFAIAPVYTPPEARCQGYAGAATAALIEQMYGRGYKFAYLFTDDSNPASNRCYAKLGFRPYCDAAIHHRSDVTSNASNAGAC